jgi:acetyl-CoA acetyltransferase
MTAIAAIVGADEAPSQDSGTLSPAALMAEAAMTALAQTSLRKADIDGLFSASAYYYMPTLTLGEHLGIRPRYSDSSTIGGSSFVGHVGHAAAAIAAGRCDVALIAYGSTQRSDGSRFVKSMAEPFAYEDPYGPRWPISGYALMAARHAYEFGTTPEQLAEVAVAAREWACLNPAAPRRTPLTVDDVLSSPMVCDPLHRLDCCLVSDGAGALIVTSPDRAADVCEHPIYVHSVAETHIARTMTGYPDLTTSPAAITGPAALKEADVALADIDVFELYDSFTIAVILTLEGLGLCGRGEGGAFVSDGKLRPGGALPTNTSGGGLSNRHPGMLGIFLLIEAVRQLRHEAGERQVSRATNALVHGLGGVHMSGATAILSNERSLH